MNRELLKQTLVVLSSACGGFYLGGRYVGQLAIQSYFGPKPDWLSTTQQTLKITLVATALAVAAWIILDYRSDNE